MRIPFNKPFSTGKEFEYIAQAIAHGHLSGDGLFTKKCHAWIEENTGCRRALLTHSCTGALEMSAMLVDIQPGDEIIMPSYTFVSTANAFVLRGGTPVFADIRADTLNLDETKFEGLITPRTKAIVPVHYAGVSCEMDTIMSVAAKHHLPVIEDAAHGVMASYKGRALGSIGHLAAFSFHETKNVISGEGGALLLNDEKFFDRAEIIREKGTNRSQYFRGLVDKYSWVDKGSSYLPSDILAAFLWAQLEQAESITQRRLAVWEAYHAAFAEDEVRGRLRRPIIPEGCQHNAHMYYILLPDAKTRTALLKHLRSADIDAVFHYVPLHTSPMGLKYGRTAGTLPVTLESSERVIRLPLWVGLGKEGMTKVISAVHEFFSQ